jgi:hypothetical protein
MNGLMIKENASLRKIHDMVWMKKEDTGEFIRKHLESSDAFFQLVQASLKRSTDLDRIASWVDKVIAPLWTMEAAARVYHICSSGFDGAFAVMHGVGPLGDNAVFCQEPKCDRRLRRSKKQSAFPTII